MLKESTQKRLLKIAGLEEYEAEVLSEMKQIVEKEKILKESSHNMKKDKNEKDEKNQEKTKDKVKLSEKPFPTDGPVEEGPVGDDTELGLGDEPAVDVESGTDATVDFDQFAADFAELLSKYGGATFAVTKDGEPLSPVSEGDFGSEPELDELHSEPDGDEGLGMNEELPSEELPSEELPSEPAKDPMKESKDVAQMVFKKVIEKLNKNYSADKKKR